MTKRAAAVAAVVVAALVASAHAHAATWCGTDEVAANRVPDLEASATEQVRIVYAVPSDGTDRFLSIASAIATDVESIDNWWQRQDPSRAPRWDRYGFPGCTSRFGSLDLGFLRLPHDGAFYATDDTPGLRLNGDLADLTAGFSQKTIVYYDGPVRKQDICGETDYQATRSGGQFGFAYVYLNSTCDQTIGVGGSTAHVAAHELLHNLGAVPEGAVHSCPGDSGHVCDNPRDILYPTVESGDQLDSDILDIDHDDYYGHNGAWFDVQDSPWLTHFPQHTLHAAITGEGSIVAPNFDCAKGCDAVLDDGLQISLAAHPAPGWQLASWSGSCTGNACGLTMDGDKSVTAVFRRSPQRVSVSVAGKGSVASTPAGISCPKRCAAAFVADANVRLVAHAAAGWRFSRWSGGCSGRGGCRVRTDRARTVRAVFVHG